MLVVKEKSGGFKGKGVWKLPTGVVNEVRFLPAQGVLVLTFMMSFIIAGGKKIDKFHPQGEDICTAAIREVKEETGVSTIK